MSDLSGVEKFLEHKNFNHNTDLKFMLEECAPSHIGLKLKSCCPDTTCYHKQNKQIIAALNRFKKFLTTKGNFKVGDRVELAETPEISEATAWGWLGSKHFMVEGAKATIHDIGYYKGQFGYSVIFDDESWKERGTGVIHPIETKEKSLYYLREYQLRKSGNGTREFLSKLWSDFYYRIGD
jgi:hypothetical protein